jgi:hypothetical protein
MVLEQFANLDQSLQTQRRNTLKSIIPPHGEPCWCAADGRFQRSGGCKPPQSTASGIIDFFEIRKPRGLAPAICPQFSALALQLRFSSELSLLG